MLKMVIRMDDEKINREKIYRLAGVYDAIDQVFRASGLPRAEGPSGTLVYRDCGRAKDFGLFGRIVNHLKRQAWFMENVAQWQFCDSDDSDSPDDFNEEDLLAHYRRKRAAGA